MAFDPSVIGSISDSQANPLKAQQDANTLYDSKNRVQMNALTLQQAKEDKADKEAVKKILQSAGNKLSTDQGVNEVSEKIAQVSPDLAMKFKSDISGMKMQDLDVKLKQLQVAQDQQLPMLGAMDQTIRELQPMKDMVDKGKYTSADLDAMVARKMLPQIQQLSKDHPELAPYLNKYMQNPKALTYDSLVSQFNQSKQGREMMKQHEQEIRDAQRQQGLDIQNKRMEGYLASIASQNKARDSRVADKEAGKLDQDTLHDMATQYVVMGDRSVFQNLGRGQQAADNIVALRKMARQVMLERGWKPEQISAKVAEFNGIQAEFRALGTREAQVRNAAAEFHHVDENGKETGVVVPALKASEKLPREKWVPLNELVQTYQKMNSKSELYRFGQAIDTLVNVYARAIAPTGVPPEASRKRALEKLSTAMDQESFEAVVDFMETEIDQAQISPQKVRDDIMREITNSGQAAPGQPARRPGQEKSGPAAAKKAAPAATAAKQTMSDDDLVSHYAQ